jgi:putative DNA primase/helicase
MREPPIWVTEPELVESAQQAREEKPKANGHTAPFPGNGPQIPTINVVPGQRHVAADQGIQALVDAGVPFYQRGVALVRIAPTKAKDASGTVFEVPGIVPLDLATLERALGQAAIWQRFDARTKKDQVIDPPKPVVQQIMAMVGEWPFGPLTGIIQCPTLRRDGSLLDKEGYDDQTGLVLVNSIRIAPIADIPTRKDAEEALALLLELLAEFPFVDEASRSVALSKILTPVLRGAMEVAPMHLDTAPRPGTGKSYLADCASMIATGDRCAVKSQSRNQDETEKRLIGSALEGRPIVALDNCRTTLEGDFLCQLIERPLLSLRALGSSDMHRIPNTFTVSSNGNNVGVADDMVRRTIRCAMDANVENPEKRSFKAAPLALIQANRSNYVRACLVIARAYIAAERPNRLTPLPSFEGWSAFVREPLVWLGRADPVDTMEALRLEDPAGSDRYDVFDAWKSAIGVGKQRALFTHEIIAQAGTSTALHDALATIGAPRFGIGIEPKALGKWLSKHEKTIACGCKLLVDRTDKSRPKWYLELQGR